MSRVLSALREVNDITARLPAAAASPAGVELFRRAVMRLDDEIGRLNEPPRTEQAIHSELATLGGQLAALADRLGGVQGPVAVTLLALACFSLSSLGRAFCGGLITPLATQDAFRWASACRLAFTAGHAALVTQRAQAESERSTLVGAAGSGIQQAWAANAGFQLGAVVSVMASLSVASMPSQAESAFAGSTARPSSLLPWLSEVTEALLVAGPRDEEINEKSIHNYPPLLDHIFTTPAYSKHAAGLGSCAPLQTSVARLLLRRCIPATVHGYTQCQALTEENANCVGQVVFLMLNDQLRPAVDSELCQPGAAAAVVQQAAALAAALPASRPANVRSGYFAAAHRAVVLLLTLATEVLLPGEQPEGSSADAGGSAAGSSADAASSAAGGSADVAGSRRALGTAWAPGSDEWWAATTPVLQLLPRYAAVLRTLAADPECPQRSLGALCNNLYIPLEGLLLYRGGLASVTATPQEVQAWAAAAEAGVRLQPLLAQLLMRPWQDEEDCNAFIQLSHVLLLPLWGSAPSMPISSDAESMVATGCSLWGVHSTACRLLHWLAATSGEAGRQQLAACDGPPSPAYWQSLLDGLRRLYLRADYYFTTHIPREAEAAEEQAVREWWARALAVAHWAAVQACASAAAAAAAAAADTDPGHPGAAPRPSVTEVHIAVVETLRLAYACPSLVGPQLLANLTQAWAALLQHASGASKEQELAIDYLPELLQKTAATAAYVPRLAAALVAELGMRGSEGTGGAQVADVVRRRIADDEGVAAQLLASCREVLTTLVEAGEQASSSLQAASPTGAGFATSEPVTGEAGASQQPQQQPSELAAQIEAAAGRLQQLLRQSGPRMTDATAQEQQQGNRGGTGGSIRGEAARQQGGSEASAAQQLEGMQRQLLPPAAELASLLQACLQLPEQQAAAALELAQAAAACSCAHLRCANVALEGGPGEGEGRGCKWCGGCRVARYCCTACSHADWRGSPGHRRLCKRLAAAAAEAREEEAGC